MNHSTIPSRIHTAATWRIVVVIMLFAASTDPARADEPTKRKDKPAPDPAAKTPPKPKTPLPNLVEGKPGLVSSYAAKRGPRRIVLLPDGKRVLTSHETDIHMWDITNGSLLRTFRGHNILVTGIAATPDGKSLVSAGADGAVIVWSIDDGKQRQRLRPPPAVDGKAISDCAVAYDGKRIYAIVQNFGLCEWDVITGMLLREVRIPNYPFRMFYSDSNQKILVGSTRAASNLLDIASFRIEVTFANEQELDSMIRAVLSADGTRAYTTHTDGRISIWTTSPRNKERDLTGHTKGATALALTSDGKRLISGGNDRTIRVWNLTKNVEEYHATFQDEVNDLVLTPDERRVFVGVRQGLILWRLPK